MSAKMDRRRKFDPGHECPSCGAKICTWSGKHNGPGGMPRNKRVLCGEPHCLSVSRYKARMKGNQTRWGKKVSA